jgi:hypothetical protein
MYSSYRCRLLNILDAIFEACSLWEYQAPVESKMGAYNLMHHAKHRFNMEYTGLNTLQIIKQCEVAVSKLTAYALTSENYLLKKKADFSCHDFKRLVFLEVITPLKYLISTLPQGSTYSYLSCVLGLRVAEAHLWLH